MNKQKGFDYDQPDRVSKKVRLVTLSVVEGFIQVTKNQVTRIESRKIKNNKAMTPSTIPPLKGAGGCQTVEVCK